MMTAVAIALTLLAAVPATAQDGWTDDQIVPGQTPIRAVHFTELRARINARLTSCGAGAYPFTDPTITAGVTPVRSVHVTELREALGAAYAACGRPRPTWSSPAPQAGSTIIRALHITELRTAVAALRDLGDPGATSFALSGTVRDGRTNGPLLAGATVQIEGGESTRADSDGRYRFQNVAGTIDVTASADPNYVAGTATVTVDRHREVDFDLRHTGTPPFSGTVFITPNVLTSADQTSLQDVTYIGRGERTIFDARIEEWRPVDVYLFEARYSSGTLEFQVNPEFGSVDAAQAEVDTYAPAIGRLPAALLSGLVYATVNAGTERFRAAVGGSLHGGVIIHTGQGAEYSEIGFLEEVFLHEAGHAAFDLDHANAEGWRAAQQDDDGVFISTYARDHPEREDIAESILPYFVVRYRPDRLTAADRLAILTAIPNRLIYFDELELDMAPYTVTGSLAPVFGTMSAEPVPAPPRRAWQVFEGPPTTRPR